MVPRLIKGLELAAMLRVRLKADGRLVEIMPDGSERAVVYTDTEPKSPRLGSDTLSVNRPVLDAPHARYVRGLARLTQPAFAAQIGVPVETVRNWEQGKRSPRGPARALLKVIEHAPQAAFAVLGGEAR